ncbi:N-acetylmuramoyl-L-alanine amidase, partial [Candidatus Gastranaerophilus sp. (ex Termes propinquus)]
MLLISIHQNSLPDIKDVNKKHGAGTYYYNDMAHPLAQEIQKELLLATGFRDDGVNFASFALTRPTEMVSVLVECGYLIHPYELKKLICKEFQKEIAKSIRLGIENYLREINP